MASEGTATFSLTINKGSFQDSRQFSYSFDVAATPHVSIGVQSIATSYEAVAISADVATLGMAQFRNLDATNYVELGIVVSATFYPFLRLKPGEGAEGRLSPSVTLYAQSHTAACDLEYRVYEA